MLKWKMWKRGRWLLPKLQNVFSFMRCETSFANLLARLDVLCKSVMKSVMKSDEDFRSMFIYYRVILPWTSEKPSQSMQNHPSRKLVPCARNRTDTRTAQKIQLRIRDRPNPVQLRNSVTWPERQISSLLF